jgi:hypothetical protein
MVHKTLARSYSGFQALGLPFTSLFCVTRAQQVHDCRGYVPSQQGQLVVGGARSDVLKGDGHARDRVEKATLTETTTCHATTVYVLVGCVHELVHKTNIQTVTCARPHTTNVCGRMLVEMALLRFCSRGTDMKNR